MGGLDDSIALTSSRATCFLEWGMEYGGELIGVAVPVSMLRIALEVSPGVVLKTDW